MRLCQDGIFCTWRCFIQVPSHDSSPPFWLIHVCLNVSTHASLKVWPSCCCLMEVDNANTLSLMRHRTKPQKSSNQATKRVHGPCVPAPFFLGGYAKFTTSALGRNTRLCRKVTTVICALPSLYPSLGTQSLSLSATIDFTKYKSSLLN